VIEAPLYLLVPYLRHLDECEGDDRDPMDDRCICGLRQVYHKIDTAYIHRERKE
jgi:hypothetical protein